jgi:cyclophilin family peptidyl-prolyl cis-trans isomerase
MLERTGSISPRLGARSGSRHARTSHKLEFDPLESRALLTASLAAIANITAPAGLGYQVPLDGTAGGATSQTYTVTSSNPDVKATVATGDFLNLNVTHTSSGAGDPAFTGNLTFQLFGDLTPNSVASIENLVTSGFYTNKNFHRITSGFPDSTGFIVQGGSVTGTGLDSPPAAGQPGGLPATGYPFPDEFNQQLAFTNPGELALANAGENTNTSQFFITNSDPRFLDFGYTIFGQLVAGTDTNGNSTLTDLTEVALTPTTDGSTPSAPIIPPIINSAVLSTTNPDGVIHVDTTGATAGETSTITVTATDPSTNTTATQSFLVTVGATDPTNPDGGPEKPLLATFPSNVTVGLNQTAVYKITGVSAGSPADPLTYTVDGGVSADNTTFTTVQNATATVDANGVVTVTPNPGFSGTINLVVGVRDQTDRTGQGGAGLNTPANYDVHPMTITVNADATQINLPPIASPVTVNAPTGSPTTIQLAGNTANPQSNQTLVYTLLSQPTNGTISNFNATTGTLTYTSSAAFQGTDTFTYQTTDVGAPTPNLTSAPGTVTVNVAAGNTGAVRQIGTVLVVTPVATPHKHNSITVDEVNGNIQVTVNGVLDATQPAATSLSEIVVYGENTGNTIDITPNVQVATSLDGGHGGRNFIKGDGPFSTINAWFGKNVVQGGSGANAIVGQKGKIKILKSDGTDSIFVSPINPSKRLPHYKPASRKVNEPIGSFYKFAGKKLVATKFPASIKIKQH